MCNRAFGRHGKRLGVTSRVLCKNKRTNEFTHAKEGCGVGSRMRAHTVYVYVGFARSRRGTAEFPLGRTALPFRRPGAERKQERLGLKETVTPARRDLPQVL